MTAVELRLEGLGVQYGSGHWAVRGIDLVVPAGSVMGVVGESGSGKSTIARAAVGLAPVTEGRILLDGQDAPWTGRGPRPVQMVFQDPSSALDPRRTIGSAVAEGMGDVRGAARAAAVAELLEQVHLDPAVADRYPADLSGGQRQRVAIARALAAQPRVLFADEITSALDVSVQGAVLNQLRAIQRDLHLTTVFISHNLAVVAYMSDYITVMRDGRIVESGPAEELVADPQETYTQELLAAVPSVGERFLDPEVPR